jgi:hypothetical protein
VGIVLGSTIKGIVAGMVIGLFARRVHSVAKGVLFGLAVGLCLAFGVALLQHGDHFQVMLPGGLVGLVVGYATQRYGYTGPGETPARQSELTGLTQEGHATP